MAQPTSTRTHTHTNTLTLSDTNTHTNAEKKRLTSARSLGSKLSGIHPVVELPLLCFAATPTRHQCHAHAQSYQAAIHLPQRQPSVYRVVYWQQSHGTWLRGMPQRVQFIKLNMAVALCSSPVRCCCCNAGAAVAMQPDVVHIFCFSFCRFCCFCCFCRCLRCALYYQQSYVCPSVSRIPYSVSRYAICRVPFPDLCNSMHVPHFCSKTCRTCMWCMAATKIPQKVPQTLNLKHVARCTNSAASSLIEFATTWV